MHVVAINLKQNNYDAVQAECGYNKASCRERSEYNYIVHFGKKHILISVLFSRSIQMCQQ